MKKNSNTVIVAATALVFGLVLTAAPVVMAIKVDGVTGATIPVKRGSLSLTGETLMSLLKYGGAGYLLSTVSEDGVPHIAPVTPQIDKDGNILITSTYTKTRENIDNNGVAMLAVYAINCGGKDMGMHLGGRLQLSRVGEPVSKDKIKSYGLRTLVLSIEKELPLVEEEFKRPTAPYRR